MSNKEGCTHQGERAGGYNDVDVAAPARILGRANCRHAYSIGRGRGEVVFVVTREDKNI